MKHDIITDTQYKLMPIIILMIFKHILLGVCFLFFSLISVALQSAEQNDCDKIAKVVEIDKGIYVRPGQHAMAFEQNNIANIGFIIGEKCVAVIDTGGSYTEGKEFACAIKKVTEKPICYVINTHVHPDHMLGNLAFKDTKTEFVGHHKLPRAMAILGPTYLQRASEHSGQNLSEDHIVLPTTTVKDTLQLDLGGRILLVTAHPTAHTETDLSIYDQATNTLWLADLLFMEHIPVIAGSLSGWLNLIEMLKTSPAECVVPGHGPTKAPWPESASNLRRYLSNLQVETREWIAEGGDIQGAQKNIGLSEAEHWQLFQNHHKRNVISAFTEIEWE